MMALLLDFIEDGSEILFTMVIYYKVLRICKLNRSKVRQVKSVKVKLKDQITCRPKVSLDRHFPDSHVKLFTSVAFRCGR